MKKLIYGTLFLASIGIGIVACKKESLSTSTENNQAISKTKKDQNLYNNKSIQTVIDENNIGYHHNEMAKYVVSELKKQQTALAINTKANQAGYIKSLMKNYCVTNNIAVPNNFTSVPNNLVYTDVTSNAIFSSNEKNLLNQSFAMVDAISDTTNCVLLYNKLKSNLNTLAGMPNTQGKSIAKAMVNQLMSSLDLWILKDYDTYLPSVKPPKPGQNKRVLTRDAVAMGFTLITGAYSSALGWCGSMFVGCGASIGKWMDENGYDTTWWPF